MQKDDRQQKSSLDAKDEHANETPAGQGEKPGPDSEESSSSESSTTLENPKIGEGPQEDTDEDDNPSTLIEALKRAHEKTSASGAKQAKTVESPRMGDPQWSRYTVARPTSSPASRSAL